MEVVTRGEFKARLLANRYDGIMELDVWSDDLTPLSIRKRTIREWAEEHIRDHFFNDLIDLFEIPEHWNNFEIVFSATIECSRTYCWEYGCYEYEEEIYPKDGHIKQQLPDCWFDWEFEHGMYVDE